MFWCIDSWFISTIFIRVASFRAVVVSKARTPLCVEPPREVPEASDSS
jgi:hypothetical protein